MGAIQSPHCNTTNILPPHADQSYWMSKLPDQILISHLSIPGSHRSCSWQLTRGYQYQGLDPYEALKSGIRFFDVSIHMKAKNVFYLWQSNYPVGGTLISVIGPFLTFLRSSSSEVIFCCLTECYSTSCTDNFPDSVWEFLTTNIEANMLWSSKELPRTLGEARGKIVFLRNYSDPKERLVGYSKAVLSNQNGLPCTIKGHFAVIQKQLQEVIQGNEESLYITFTSIKPLRVFPRDNANRINFYLRDFIKLYSKPIRLGIIAMDFPGQGLIDEIIQCNSGIAFRRRNSVVQLDKSVNKGVSELNPLLNVLR